MKNLFYKMTYLMFKYVKNIVNPVLVYKLFINIFFGNKLMKIKNNKFKNY